MDKLTIIQLTIIALLIYNYTQNAEYMIPYPSVTNLRTKSIESRVTGNLLEAMDGSSEPINVYLFHRPNCPHCVKMKPDWDRMALSNFPSNYTIHTINTTDPLNQGLAKKYGVSGVPHIVKATSTGYTVYQGARTADAMKAWILS